MTSISFENENGMYTISLVDNLVVLDDVMRDLIRPLLLSAGYQPGNIDDYITDD